MKQINQEDDHKNCSFDESSKTQKHSNRKIKKPSADNKRPFYQLRSSSRIILSTLLSAFLHLHINSGDRALGQYKKCRGVPLKI